MHRGWMDNPVLKTNDERIVWLCIIQRAAWSDTHTTINGQRVECARGGFYTALRHLCAYVDWDVKKVSRFLKRLEECHMIVTSVTTGMTHITVCNYDEYQSGGHKNDTDMSQELPHKEIINNKKENTLTGWDEFHSAYPCGLLENGKPRRWPKSGRDSAQNRFREAIRSGATVEQLVLAAVNYAQEKSDGMYVKNPKRFLTDGDWKDWLEVKDTSDAGVFKSGWDYQ